MSLVPSPPGAPFPPPPLALFNSFLSQHSPSKDGEKQSESSDGSSPMDSEENAEKSEDGAVSATQPQQQQHPMDFPALAMHLLQQAQLEMFGGGGGGSQHGGKPFPPSFSCLPASAPSPTAAPPASSTSKRPSPSHPKSGSSSSASSSGSSGSRRSGSGRSGSGAPPPPAISAALLAPSPLGALPAIPGALAVAASPAAQLFRDDDWSWHRNPAAAIRSGGTNKQTPVWKYFVYNKTENLSRCIVGTCTYQLKGPHTSTLACHLKKHAAEYAEFQRLKAEYTRERVICGQQQPGGSNPNMASLGGSSSSCSTPSSQSNGGGGVLAVRENPTKCEEARRSPQEGRTNIMGPNHHHPFSSCTPSPGPGFGRADNGMVEQHPEYHYPHLNNHFQPFAPPATLSHHHPLNGSIFGPLHPHHSLNGFCFPHPPPAPPQFHHLMMAAAMAAANGTNGTRPGSGAPQPPENVAVLCPEGAARRAEEGKVPKRMKREKQTGGSGSGGTGANLLDILNLLSKRAAAAAAEKEEREQEEEVEEEEGDEMKSEKGRRKKKRRKMMKMEDEEEAEGRAHRLTHSVEHLLLKEEEEEREDGGGRMKKAKMEKTDEDDEEEEEEMMRKDGGDDEHDEEKDAEEEPKEMNTDERMGHEDDEEHLEDDKWVPDEKAEEDEDEVMGKKNRVEDEEEDDHPPLGLRDTLALSLATSFSRSALRHLLEDNPFFRHFRFPSSAAGEEGLTLEQVEEVLDGQWASLRRQLGARLARGPFALLALLRCACCRLPPAQCPCPSSSVFCSLTALIPGGDDSPPPLLLAMRPLRGVDQTDRQQLESLVEQILAEYAPSGSAPLRPCFILVHPPPSSSSSSLPSLPAFLSRSLQNTVHQMLREDAELKQLRNKFWEKVRAMTDSGDQAESEMVTGITMPSGDLIPASDDVDAFFKFAPPILEKHGEFCQIWEAKADGPREKANMDEWEWQSLRESVRLFEFCKSFEQEHHQMTGETANVVVGHWEHTLGTIRENFPALGELAKSLAADLANKTGIAMEMAKNTMYWEPLIFPQGTAGGENEDEKEWAERNVLLLANWRPRTS